MAPMADPDRARATRRAFLGVMEGITLTVTGHLSYIVGTSLGEFLR